MSEVKYVILLTVKPVVTKVSVVTIVEIVTYFTEVHGSDIKDSSKSNFSSYINDSVDSSKIISSIDKSDSS